MTGGDPHFVPADVAWTGPSADPNDEQFGDVVTATDPDAAGEYDAVIVGEPYDGAVIGRPGAREGPAAIRESLAATKSHHFGAGPVGGVADLGTLAALDGSEREESRDDGGGCDPRSDDGGSREESRSGGSGRGTSRDGGETGTVERVQAAVREATAAVHALDALPVFLGGDNSLTYPNVAPLLSDGSVGVLNFDAHLDVREYRPDSSGAPDATSGTPYRQLFEAGLDGYACVGARHFETSTAYHRYVRERGGRVVTAETVGADPLDALDLAFGALADVETLYVSVDVDVLDGAAAPGVSAPTPGGLASRELFRLLRAVAGDPRVAGFEVVETAPPLDESGRTADAAARAVAHFLAGCAGADHGGN